MRVPSLEVAVFIVIFSIWSLLGFYAAPSRRSTFSSRGSPVRSARRYASAVRGPIGEVDYARGESFRVHELERRPFLALLEEPLTAPQDHGVDEEIELVEQAVPKQRPDQGGAA